MKDLPFGRYLNTEGIRIQDVPKESELRELLEMNEQEFETFRKETGLPFVEITKGKRFYFGQDLVELFGKRRVVPGRSV